MVSSSSRRRAVKYAVEEGLGSTTQACRAVGMNRSSYYAPSRKKAESVVLEGMIVELSEEHPRYGYRRVTALLRRDGEKVNAKRVQRVRRRQGLEVSKKQRRMRRLGISSAQRQKAERLNEVWSWDFVEDQTENGTRFRVLTLIDEYSRRCLAMHAGWSIRAVDVIEVVQGAMERYGKPAHIRSDNGPEFMAYAIGDWLEAAAVGTIYIEPGSPWENAYIESFHDKLRDECLNRELFGSLREAQVILGQWRREYNEERPHSALGYWTPQEYATASANQLDGGYAPPNPAPLAAAGVRREQQTMPRRQINTKQQTTNQLAEL
jgi:putative transposase